MNHSVLCVIYYKTDFNQGAPDLNKFKLACEIGFDQTSYHTGKKLKVDINQFSKPIFTFFLGKIYIK